MPELSDDSNKEDDPITISEMSIDNTIIDEYDNHNR